jgi:hypothetical protein
VRPGKIAEIRQGRRAAAFGYDLVPMLRVGMHMELLEIQTFPLDVALRTRQDAALPGLPA